MIRDTSSSSSMIWFCAVALRMIVSIAATDLVGSELAALEQVGPPDDRGQRRPQLVRQGRQELVLHAAGRLGRRARLLRLPVEVRVVDGDGRVGREAGDQALVTLMENPGVRDVRRRDRPAGRRCPSARAPRDSSVPAKCRAASA